MVSVHRMYFPSAVFNLLSVPSQRISSCRQHRLQSSKYTVIVIFREDCDCDLQSRLWLRSSKKIVTAIFKADCNCDLQRRLWYSEMSVLQAKLNATWLAQSFTELIWCRPRASIDTVISSVVSSHVITVNENHNYTRTVCRFKRNHPLNLRDLI